VTKRICIVVLVSALTSLGIVLSSAADDRTDEDEAQPLDNDCNGPCPLHDWMEKNVQAAVEDGNTRALSKALKRAAEFAPDPSWNAGPHAWRTISLAGAEKAAAGDMPGARASCKGCHQAWRKQYKAQYRARPVPR